MGKKFFLIYSILFNYHFNIYIYNLDKILYLYLLYTLIAIMNQKEP